MEKNHSGSFAYSPTGGGPGDEKAQDLDRRIRQYEELEAQGQLQGGLGAGDYSAIFLLTLGLVVTFYLWGY